MSSVSLKTTGSWKKTEDFLERNSQVNSIVQILERYGREGVAALSSVTPVDTGRTASSWFYEIVQNENEIQLVFKNNNLTSTGVPIAILLQYGHGNGRGGYVRGTDYINPVIQPIFDKIEAEVWKEVSK